METNEIEFKRMKEDLDSIIMEHEDAMRWYGKRAVHPFEEYEMESDYSTWVPADQTGIIKVEYIGEVCDGMKKGIIVSSFNAG